MSLLSAKEVPPETAVVFDDDFTSEQLDRTRWNVRTTGRVVNNEQQAYVDAEETLYIAPGDEIPGATGNVLVLHPRYRPDFTTEDGQRFDFISARIDTREKFHFTYGIASARIKLPVGPGLWPAFWAMGTGKWPGTGEIDIMECVGERDWTSCAVHGSGYYGESGLVNKLFFPSGEDVTSWHVYAVEWGPDRLIFKVDGSTVYRVTRPMIDFFGSWAFDNEKYLILNFALGGTYPFKTSGVREPYYGIAEQTVNEIKRNQARILVDWVRVDQITTR